MNTVITIIMKKYNNRLITSAEVIEELLNLSKEVVDAKEQVEEEVLPAVEEKKEEKPNKKSCDCKRQLTTKDVFGYMWMGQIYGE